MGEVYPLNRGFDGKDWTEDGPNAKSMGPCGCFFGLHWKAGKYEGSGNTNKTINSHGFISTPEITIKNLTNQSYFRWRSSTAGVSPILADNETAMDHHNKLRTQFPKNIEFINAALAGYTLLNHTAGYGANLDFVSDH